MVIRRTLFTLIAAAPLITAQALDPALLNALPYRNLGAFRAGAWTVAAAIPETPAKAHRTTIYAALRTGGVFKSTDGGRTWQKVLYVGDRVGAVDLVRDPRTPDVLYAATYEHQRLAWVINDGGSGTGIYKTTDGGATWKELTNGLPKGPMGRIGMDICRTKPDTLYAVYDNHN